MDTSFAMVIAETTGWTLALIFLAFAVGAAALWGLLSLVGWGLGKTGLFRRAGRRFDALDDAVDQASTPEERFARDVDVLQRSRGHDPHTR